MKKLIAIILILVSLVSVSCADFSVYPLGGRIIDFNYEEDEVFFVDANGNVWVFYETEDWEIDDFVACLMWDGGTPDDIWDDEILDVCYCGF